MATFLQLTQEIEDELGKGGLQLLTTQVKQAINDAIAYYEIYPFRFNQGFDNSITTVSGTEAYNIPTNLLILNRAQILYTASDLRRLTIYFWEDYQEWREGYNSTQGQSDICMIYDDDIYLYPTPNGTYTLQLWYTKRLANVPFTANSQSNEWSGRARNLIKARAKYLLLMHRIQNSEWAEVMALEEAAQLRSLQSENARQNAPRELMPELI
jgi:hypothetical protein